MRFHTCTYSACTRTSPKIHKPPRPLRAKQCPRATPLSKHVFVIITTNHAEAGSRAAAAQPLKPKHTFAARNTCTPSWQSRGATSTSNINELHTKSRWPHTCASKAWICAKSKHTTSRLTPRTHSTTRSNHSNICVSNISGGASAPRKRSAAHI